MYRLFIIMCFFSSKNSRKVAISPSPALGAAVGCTKNYHSHCVESFEGLLHSAIGEGGGCSEL